MNLGSDGAKTEWPKTGAHSQLLRDLQETVPNCGYTTTQKCLALWSFVSVFLPCPLAKLDGIALCISRAGLPARQEKKWSE